MKKGDVVTIYKDPITKKKPEGEAWLVEKMREDFDQDFWLVRFTDDGYITGRFIEKSEARLSP